MRPGASRLATSQVFIAQLFSIGSTNRRSSSALNPAYFDSGGVSIISFPPPTFKKLIKNFIFYIKRISSCNSATNNE